MSDLTQHARFAGLINLAAEELGGHAVACSDDFFASMHNLVKPGRGVFLPDEYTDRGKWMDGWESRRKREPGHDWCVVALGAPGVVRALDIDTNHFLGNHPPYASVEATHVDDASLAAARWTELLPQSPLRPGSQNLFASSCAETFTHLRLNIFPDGGVARLRVWGEVRARWDAPDFDEATRAHVAGSEVDLAAVINGGKALACSDAFFGPMDNLLLPGRAHNMGGGWETRRKRPAPGHDWIVVRMGARGTLSTIELDTNHFKGNFAERVSVGGIDAPHMALTDLVRPDAEFETILNLVTLKAHTRHFFKEELAARGPYTHLKIDVFPDGGISRFRAWGARSEA